MKIATSMKHNYFILAAIAFVIGLAFAGCKKQEQEALTPKITNDKVETTATTATFTWTVEWVGNRVSVVELSENEDMSHSQFYGSEEELNKTEFIVTANDLQPATKYYYRFWVWNHNYLNNKFVMGTKHFTTSTDVPIVKTKEVMDVTTVAATMIGELVDDCGAEVTECGFCWSTGSGPDINGSHKKCDAVSDHFTLSITGLNAETKYYVRAYATNRIGTGYGNEMTFFTGDATLPEVSIVNIAVGSASITVDCNVTSDGGVAVTKRGVCWSTSPNPESSGSHLTNGSGVGAFSVNLNGLNSSTTYHVRAYAMNSVGTAYSDDLTFVTSDAPQSPTGAIGGLFSVSETRKVWFSKGNLQYIGSASTPYWKFADEQWAVIGNSQGSTAPNVDRDLFGWGTSGYYNSGDPYCVNYRPYSTSTSTVNTSYNYYGYGPSTNQGNPNIAGTHYDWGVHNKISNGGNYAGLWRTLTQEEWFYVLKERDASTINGANNARYAKANVNGVQGVILFPDSYSHPSDVAAPFGVNDSGDSGWYYNSYWASDWTQMEVRGCVFLPAAGYRYGASLNYVGSGGYYWSASYSTKYSASYLQFYNSHLSTQETMSRCNGQSVRLVRNAE